MTDISKKQYLISSTPLVLDGMKERRLGQVYLYTGEKLNITECRTADSKVALIIGNAFCTDAQDKRVERDVEKCEEKDILGATRYWTGRWALITENLISVDATGLMSAFYLTEDGGWLISSSLALISRVTGKDTVGNVRRVGLTWQMLPYTIIPGVKGISCFQYIDFSSGEIRPCPKVWVLDKRETGTEEKCRAVSEMLVNAAHNIHKYSGKRILLALTGGKDSRVTFSALLKSGVPFSAYTAEHTNISSADKTVPKKLCKMFGIEHRYIKREGFSKQKYNDYLNFCAGNSNGADADFYACGQFSKIDEDTVVIRSGIFELGQTFARGYASPEAESFAKDVKSFYSELSGGGAQEKAFDEYMRFVKEMPVEHIDLRDRYYLEQRVGGWASAIEQSLDINGFTSVQIANCEELLSVLASCNEKERAELSLSYEVIRMLEPRALDVPVNKRTLADKLGRVASVLNDPVGKIKRVINKFTRL